MIPLAMVRRAVERAIDSSQLPGDDDDLLDTAAVDSMGWVAILSALEQQAGAPHLGAQWPPGKPHSIRVLAELLAENTAQPERRVIERRESLRVGIRGWGTALGSRTVSACDLDVEYGLPARTIGARTGLESVARATESETETTLARRACEEALCAARVELDQIDLLVAASETFLGFPSLAAVLHSSLLLPEACWALDVGGGCLALLNALATARAILAAGEARLALVVAADVHSRRLAGTSTPWQLAALFGDGAGAILLDGAAGVSSHRLGEFSFGCAGSFAGALRIAPGEAGDLSVEFRGHQLADAAISRLSGLIQELDGGEADAFAIHEPNPRALELVAKRTGIPLEKFVQLSRASGNLGSATCAVGISRLLERRPPPRTIFLAALGPGLLWGAGHCVIEPQP